MDRESPGAFPKLSAGESSVTSSLTTITLLVGVFGGLVVVVTVLLICKHCQDKKKPQIEQYRETSHDRRTTRTRLGQHRYGTNSYNVISNLNPCSILGTSLTSQTCPNFRFPELVCDPTGVSTELTYCRSDLDTNVRDPSGTDSKTLTQVETGESQMCRSVQGILHVGEGRDRRISFLFDNRPVSSSCSIYKMPRYIQGDFHHLKRSKISRFTSRQLSEATISSGIGDHDLLRSSQVRFSSLDEHLITNTVSAGRECGKHDHMSGLKPAVQYQAGGIYRNSIEREMFRKQAHALTAHALMEQQESYPRTYKSGSSFLNPESPLQADVGVNRRTQLSSSDSCFREKSANNMPLTSTGVEDRRNLPVSLPRSHKAPDCVYPTFARPRRMKISAVVHPGNRETRDADSANARRQHHTQRENKYSSRDYLSSCRKVPSLTNTTQATCGTFSAHSLDLTRQRLYRDSRQVKSYDQYLEKYNVLDTEFSEGQSANNDFDINEVMGSPTGSEVTCYDKGSLEKLKTEAGDLYSNHTLDEISETENRRQPHGQANSLLWKVRTNVEDERTRSKNKIRTVEVTSPYDLYELEHMSYKMAPLKCTVQNDHRSANHKDSGQSRKSTSTLGNRAKFLLQHYYRCATSDGLEIRDRPPPFDSSTTSDANDSVSETKLQQMKTDSGYTSMETQHLSREVGDREIREAGRSGRPIDQGDRESSKWNVRISLESGEELAVKRESRTVETRHRTVSNRHRGQVVVTCCDSLPSNSRESTAASGSDILWKTSAALWHCDRRDGKTASRKRREYSREKRACDVTRESETDHHSGDRSEGGHLPNKISVFARLFTPGHGGHRTHYLTRDYSIDQATNDIFNEFVRQEIPQSARKPTINTRLTNSMSLGASSQSLQRKHTDPVDCNMTRVAGHDSLATSKRSVSLGSDRNQRCYKSVADIYMAGDRPHLDGRRQTIFRWPETDPIQMAGDRRYSDGRRQTIFRWPETDHI